MSITIITAKEMLMNSKENFLKNHPEMTSEVYDQIMKDSHQKAFQEIFDSFLEVKPIS